MLIGQKINNNIVIILKLENLIEYLLINKINDKISKPFEIK